jgi:hypothetical protein
MRFEDKPVEVSYLTRRVPTNPLPGSIPRSCEETRTFASYGGRTIPEDTFQDLCQSIREKTRLRLEEPIGAGGTGVVFVARHEELPLRRAIKVMYYRDREDRDEFLDTLRGSLQTVARMRHSGLVEIHDAVATDEYAYVQMCKWGRFLQMGTLLISLVGPVN